MKLFLVEVVFMLQAQLLLYKDKLCINTYIHTYVHMTNTATQGVRFLHEKGLLNRTAEDVAMFLFVNQLDKGAIGDYLGEG